MTQKAKPKKKKTDERRLHSWQFILIWVVAHIVAWLAAWWVLDSMGRFNPFELTNAVLMGLIIGVPIAIVQQQLAMRLLDADLRYWIPVSAVGWAISGIILHFTASGDASFSLQILLFFLIPALLQAIILWQHVRNAWLWVLANAIGGIVMALPIASTRGDELTVLTIGGALQTVVSGIAMYWLFRQPETEKAKKEKVKAG